MQECQLPVDRGWAWFIMFACFGVHLTCASLAKCFGVLLVDFQEKFGSSLWALTTTQGMSMFLWLGLAPVSNALSVRFTTRVVMFSGGVLGTMGFVGSSLVQSLPVFFVFQGLVVGVGYGLTYSPCLVMLTQYFKRYRGLALSVSQSGAALGSILMPMAIRWLVGNFGLQGSMLIQGALMANVCVFAMLVRPTSYYRKHHQLTIAGRGDITEIAIDSIDDHRKATDKTTANIFGEPNVAKISHDKESNVEAFSSLLIDDNDESSKICPCTEQKSGSLASESNKESLYKNSTSVGDTFRIGNRPRKMQTNKNYSCLLLNRKYFDWSLFRNPIFLGYLTAGICSESIWECSFMMLPSIALVRSFSRTNANRVTTIVGCADLISRLAVGSITDFIRIPRRYIFTASVLFAGLVAFLVPFFTQRSYFITLCVLYGVFGAFNTALIVLVLADELGTEIVSNAIGILYLFEAVGIVSSAQIVGSLFDVTGDWHASFWFMSSLGVLGGVVTLLPALRWCKKFGQRTSHVLIVDDCRRDKI